MDETKDAHIDRFVKALGAAYAQAVNEPLVFAKIAEFLSPAAADLADAGEDVEDFNRRIGRLIQDLGGPPDVIVVTPGEPLSAYDDLADSLVSEMFAFFRRTRNSVIRTHCFYMTLEAVSAHRDWFEPQWTPSQEGWHLEELQDRFWEHAETSYIRLASFWDRVGQLLDFVFFGIRQYERDGFAGVMDRIRVNLLPVDSSLALSEAWDRLRKYQVSEADDGFKWLQRRRNLLVHSLHLRPLTAPRDADEVYKATFNHLDSAHREKLKPRSPREEVDLLHTQLGVAAARVRDVLEICQEKSVGQER